MVIARTVPISSATPRNAATSPTVAVRRCSVVANQSPLTAKIIICAIGCRKQNAHTAGFTLVPPRLVATGTVAWGPLASSKPEISGDGDEGEGDGGGVSVSVAPDTTAATASNGPVAT